MNIRDGVPREIETTAPLQDIAKEDTPKGVGRGYNNVAF